MSELPEKKKRTPQVRKIKEEEKAQLPVEEVKEKPKTTRKRKAVQN